MIKNIFRNLLEKFPYVIQFLRGCRDLLDRRAPSKITKWGFSLAGNDAMSAGEFEVEETELVRKILLEVDVLVNVGANIGYYCCHALSLGKSVIAVEPNVRNLHYLLTNIRNNGWSNKAEVFPLAIGECVDILEMWGGGTGASLIKGWASIPESYVTKVPVLTLDRVMGEVIYGKRSLILVDIEGAELMLLLGSIQTLTNNPKPIWIMEISARDHQPKGSTINPNFVKTFEIFFKNGYSAFTADSNQLEVSLHDVNQVAKGVKELKVYNFLFK